MQETALVGKKELITSSPLMMEWLEEILLNLSLQREDLQRNLPAQVICIDSLRINNLTELLLNLIL